MSVPDDLSKFLPKTLIYGSGLPVKLTEQNLLASGGEGTVHEVGQLLSPDYSYLGKALFDDAITEDKKNKLVYLHKIAGGLLTNFAIPLELLYDNGRKIRGFLMHKKPGRCAKEYIGKKENFEPNYTAWFLERMIDVIELLNDLHYNRAAIGDLNPGNILFDSDSSEIIDIDSIQIAGFKCEVMVSEYVDPAIIRFIRVNKTLDEPVYSPGSDFYSLAVVFFQILMGVHPREGYSSVQGVPRSLVERSVDGHYWVGHPDITPPKLMRSFDWMTPDMRRWFETMFSTDNRPVPKIEMIQQQITSLGFRYKTRTANVNPNLTNHANLTGQKMKVFGDAGRLRGDVSKLRGNLTGLRGAVNPNLRGSVTHIAGDLTKIYGDCSSLSGDISRIEGDVTGLTGNATGLIGNVTKITGQIHVKGRVDALSGDISLLWGSLGENAHLAGDATGYEACVDTQNGQIPMIRQVSSELTYFGKPK